MFLGWEIRKYAPCATACRVDTVLVSDTVTVVAPTVVEERFIPIDRVLERTDTVFIVEDYQMQRVYADTVKFEYGSVTIIDTVYQNSLVSQKVISDFQFVTPSEREYALGVGVDASSARSMAVNLHFRKRRWTFLAGYDFFNKAPVGGIKYDIVRW